MTSLVDQILAIEHALDDAGIEHAFGGALALAFHVEEPRGTRDIDVNVFVEPSSAHHVFSSLPHGVEWDGSLLDKAVSDGQVRLFWDETPVDVFFSTHLFHDHASLRVLRVPLAGSVIPILGATELVVFKAFYDRTKDWADIEAITESGTADAHAALGWLTDLLGPRDHRVSRLRNLMQRNPSGP